MSLPWLNWRSIDEVPISTSMPSTPVSMARLGILQGAARVRQHLGLEAQPGDGLAVLVALRRGGRRSQLDVLDAKLVQRVGDLHLLLGGKVGADELLAFAQGRLDDVKGLIGMVTYSPQSSSSSGASSKVSGLMLTTSSSTPQSGQSTISPSITSAELDLGVTFRAIAYHDTLLFLHYRNTPATTALRQTKRTAFPGLGKPLCCYRA